MPRPALVALTLWLLAVGATRAELEVSVVSPVTAAVGSNAVLECTYTVDSHPVNLYNVGVLWQFKDHDVLGFSVQPIAFNPRASINVSEIRNGKASLLLSDVTASDEGSYTCAVRYASQRKQKTVTLNIQGAKKEVTASPASVAVKPGEDVALNCILTVEQPPIDMKKLMVQWFHRGKQIAEYDNKITIERPEVSISEDALKTGNLSLYIAKAKVDHTGNYRCYVYYQSGVWMKEIKLKVEDPTQAKEDEEEPVRGSDSSDVPETLRWVKLVKAAVDGLQETVNLMKTDVEKCATRPHDKAP